MLPQPNFGRDTGPTGPAKEEDGEDEKPRKKLLRLQIAMWIQVAFAVVLGNIHGFVVIASRGLTEAELLADFRERELPEDITPEEAARSAYETFQSTGYLAVMLGVAVLAILAAIVAALCAMRFKSRQKTVRRWAIGATGVLVVVGMFLSTQFSLLVAPWVFASVFALWWLFAGDIRYWFDEPSKTRAEG